MRLSIGGAVIGALLLSAWATAEAQSPPSPWQKCARLYGQLARYQIHLFNHTGSKAIAEWSMYECARNDPGFSHADLEMVMRRAVIAMPAD
jgi:hypothetical protein